MSPEQIRDFVEGHNVSDLTPLQQEIFVKIVSESLHYMRLEQELSQNELYKTILKDEIDKMFEPTQSNKNAQAELNKLNNETRQGTTFGGSRQLNSGSGSDIIVSKIGNESNNTEKNDTNENSVATENSESTESNNKTEPIDSGIKLVKI
jgi:hypothetical protein